LLQPDAANYDIKDVMCYCNHTWSIPHYQIAATRCWY